LHTRIPNSKLLAGWYKSYMSLKGWGGGLARGYQKGRGRVWGGGGGGCKCHRCAFCLWGGEGVGGWGERGEGVGRCDVSLRRSHESCSKRPRFDSEIRGSARSRGSAIIRESRERKSMDPRTIARTRLGRSRVERISCLSFCSGSGIVMLFQHSRGRDARV